jgi:hypothetical protein
VLSLIPSSEIQNKIKKLPGAAVISIARLIQLRL